MSEIMSMRETFLVYESIGMRLDKLMDTPEKKLELQTLHDKMTENLMNAATKFQSDRDALKKELT